MKKHLEAYQFPYKENEKNKEGKFINDVTKNYKRNRRNEPVLVSELMIVI
jgi:hypothetical protein